jgi:hypothetical protein
MTELEQEILMKIILFIGCIWVIWELTKVPEE